MEERIKAALEIAMRYAGNDGAHHKMWTIDQMVRALTGCPLVERKALDSQESPYTFHRYGESDEYRQFVASATEGEDGPDTYEWDTGIAP
jgi:hypothetical protein